MSTCHSCAYEDECSEHVCDHVNCYNGGSCVATGPDSSVCLCPLGTAGPRCQSSEFSHSHSDIHKTNRPNSSNLWECYCNSIFMRPSYRPHYASCRSVRLSVRLSACPVRARISKTKKHRKIKICINVSQGMSKLNANFQLKRWKVKVTGRQKPPQ